MRVLVTGGAGFIGSAVCRVLSTDPAVDDIVVLDNLSSPTAVHPDAPVRLIEADIRDQYAVLQALTGIDAVIHLAARSSVTACETDPDSAWAINVEGTATLMEALQQAGTRMVVFASSAAVYGDSGHPTSVYGETKLAAESRVLAAATAALVVRPFNVYGPGQYTHPGAHPLIPTAIDAALDGTTLVLRGDGSQTRDFVYLEDAARVFAHAAVASIASPVPVDLASGSALSVLEVVHAIEQESGKPITRILEARPDAEIVDSLGDPSALKNLMPDHDVTGLDEGLRQTIAWRRATRRDA